MIKMKIAIFAAGGLAKVMCEALKIEGLYDVIGFFDDAKKGSFAGYSILGKCIDYRPLCKKFNIEGIIIGFGYYFLKERLFYYEKISNDKHLKFINAVHPAAIISPDAKIGHGVYVGPGAIINPGARIGDNSTIWSGAIIEHDNFIGKNVFITPGVKTAGYAEIGDNSFIGMGANILKVKIGKNVTVGSGSLVLEDVKDNKYIFGTPAKIIKTKNKNTYV